ncbi:MAG: DNA cytosine methyltransferase [Alicyclobacillus sp.]|nr:DNA cytosine methyltransferase [Alicyclobacillus sp.]
MQSNLFNAVNREIIVDNFAGGGGASTGIEYAIGRSVDVAINHDPAAIAMHAANHPHTKHYCESVWDVNPREATGGRPVALCWLSPDCKHFSKAKGGKPVEKSIRGLAWVAVRWAATVRPRVIILENVEEFKTWGPLLKDGKPDPKQKGRTFNAFVNALKRQGYQVDWRELRACDYGAPTIRKRLFLIARCDGRPIVWPKPTHGDPKSPEVKSGKLKPWRTAAEIIDWSLPCPSIFERDKPLAENTMRRIARGIVKFVIEDPQPFIIKVNHHGGIVSPTLIQTGYGERDGQLPRVPGLDKPLGTVVAGGQKHALVAAFLAKHYGGNYTGPGTSMDEPVATITTTDHNALVTSHLVKMYGTNTAGGNHFGEVRAFLLKYYGADIGQTCREPLHTVTTKDRFGLVTIRGQDYAIVDIGMRMLEPHELFAAQGFPPTYIIDRDANGKRYPKAAQVARCGNSVPPPFAEHLVRANLPELCAEVVEKRRAIQ